MTLRPRHALTVRITAEADIRTFLGRVAAVSGFVIYTIWDEALLSGPVVATAAWMGPWPAFALFALLYGTGGFLLAVLVVRAYARRLGQRPSRLERWVEREAGDGRQRWARSLLLRSGWLGFAVASFALGPVVTTWLLFAAGRRRESVTAVAFASSAVFAVTFVAPYVGVGRLIAGG
jgi:hypothetical protein